MRERSLLETLRSDKEPGIIETVANQEHLDILKQGVKFWNEWIVGHWSRADLGGANLIEADLGDANLSGANLSWPHLGEADLARADLRGADLSGVDLRGADLSGVDLRRADLSGVDLRRADLSKAHLHETIFSDTRLTGATGLDSCLHFGPSTVDHRTLAKSGKLPMAFLRGCGLPDALIDYLPSLLGDALQFYSCFVSYSSKDQDFAERLHADLQDTGVRCWFAPEDLKIGARTRPAIDEAIRVRDKLLLILSEKSIESDWVEKEVETAFEEESRRKETVLFPRHPTVCRVDERVRAIKVSAA